MIGERIKERREQLGWSQDELAQKLGYKSRSSINKMELGIQDVPQRKVRDFANALGVSISYLLEDHPKNAAYSIPIYSDLSCGKGSLTDERPIDYISLPPSLLFSGKAFGNIAQGDSMNPEIRNGDLLIFQETPEVESGQIGSFSLNGQYYCKRFRKFADGSCWLLSDNPEYAPIPIKPEDDFRTLGLYKLKLSKGQ